MADYNVNIPESIAAGLRTEAKATGQSIRQVLLTKLNHPPTIREPQPASVDPSPVSLDAAAAVLLSQLDSEHQKLIQECAKETGRPVSAYLLSYIMLARDQGLTAKPLPEYLGRGEPIVETVAATEPVGSVLVECAWCHRTFAPTRGGQKYCPEPDDGAEPCARKAALADIRDRRRKKVADSKIPAPHVVERRLVS